MLTDHFVEITKLRYRLQNEINPLQHPEDDLKLLDALLELLKHAAEADRRLREHLNEHEGIQRTP